MKPYDLVKPGAAPEDLKKRRKQRLRVWWVVTLFGAILLGTSQTVRAFGIGVSEPNVLLYVSAVLYVIGLLNLMKVTYGR